LKCSHTFNVLDTRGAVGVTERQALFGRMRDLSRRVAEAYLEQRRRLEFPWLKDEAESGAASVQPAAASPASTRPAGTEEAAPGALVVQPGSFLLEIGTEELPSGDLTAALDQLRERVPALLGDLRLEHGLVRVEGTPRRLVVFVENLASRQPDLEQVIKGPPAERAFDQSGRPTKVGEGFARSKGIDIADLQMREMDGGRYTVALVRQAGRSAVEILGEALPGLIAALRFDKSMRWNSSNIAFSRPIRWLLALYDSQVVPFAYAGLHSGNTTRGLRFVQPHTFVASSAQEYFNFLRMQGIILDPTERKEPIQSQVHELATVVGGTLRDDPALLDEVTNLVEAPTALRGSFDSSHLKLPREVLISVMKKHQRYFPVERSVVELLPHFIAVRNGDRQGLDLVTEGNEHVVRARFADAAFFVREDIKKPLEAHLPKLATLTFQVKLGSMLDKTQRVTAQVKELASFFGFSPEETATTLRAAELCKADLATQMVVEMTSLQGLMGRYYALNSGEPEPVAQAIYEHYLPRYAGDTLPKSRPGLVVGLADRMDTLVGLFAAGLAPSGNKDPFAQRRAALGLVQNLINWNLDFDLCQGLAWAANQLPIPTSANTLNAVLEFVIERLRNVMLEEGLRFDVVDAVLAAQGDNPAHANVAARQLSAWVKRPDWDKILPAYARCVRITRSLSETYPVIPDAFVEQVESELWQALNQAETEPRAAGSVDDFLEVFLPMIPVINQFFDKVLVMADDQRLRENRLGVLQRIARLAKGTADLSKLEGF